MSHPTTKPSSDIDGIQHKPSNQLITQSMVSQMIQHSQYVTPTIDVFRLLLPNPVARNLTGLTSATNTYDHVRANVRAIRKAGLPMLAGTDTFDQNPAILVSMGVMLHYKLANLVDAGFTPAEALRAATVIPAHQHNLTYRGVIELGKRADLGLLNSDPLVNISNSGNIA